ncbi:D-isomer specific 2-hydroxyacid dehydrogenase [Colletotrichum scovillei]|uniref:D-isomer specific 2-hydroxyacid dehydrogenase n=1 Tax=Colletotrichum scovillei TaxID=1209932 RepID=A0A9P7RE40_9PEZI|nr:D-isomer specific 2-hydroxyacid dehydrogenase [Colletotrichum scovillei]KAF4784245.1 D-isomer specific 2-hydroxyacid dehydrogenase [Colletotrichum scovillei]KAG7054346.1 D-isomer specific 2-hydroxyacid dehydrogenase [Colletotrichum scovillei]KAG7072637.1 D-isomer specific 2-hydroxyacid dehydrogenase [Colletotrichum scovillei]KAG7080876.1 D-isomer specific 2-hydroxyacid dehydrogenase [Colletotrichum scovillei]
MRLYRSPIRISTLTTPLSRSTSSCARRGSLHPVQRLYTPASYPTSSRYLATMVQVTQLKIAVLDDYQGISEPHFSKLDKSLFNVTTFKDTLLPYNHPETPEYAKDALVSRLEPFDILCTMRERTPFPKELIGRLPNLKLLLSTGLRNKGLDLPAFKDRGIPVAGTVDKATVNQTGTNSTTQHCVTLILSLARNIAADDLAVKSGLWQTDVAMGVTGKTFGVVGLGRLGVSTAKIMHVAFGMNVIAWSTNLTQEAADEKAKAEGLPVGTFKAVSREELFSTADVLSVHIVLSDRSRGLINADDLSKMKKSALFINTSRGPLVVEKDLLDVLKKGGIRGCALDVFNLEPLPADSEWRSTEWGRDGRSRVLLTPHMGYVEEGTLNAWYEQQADNIRRWQAGDALDNVLA